MSSSTADSAFSVPSTNAENVELTRGVIEHHSKSFALAGKLLSTRERYDAYALYAWCRYVDDCVDEPNGDPRAEAQRLVDELEAIYMGRTQATVIGREFQRVVFERRIPFYYPRELISGLETDATVPRFDSRDELYRYCFQVAGTVGLMMCHVLGIKNDRALRHAAHLGMGMQLTNICRDVAEDWERGRVYLPYRWLVSNGAPEAELREPKTPEGGHQQLALLRQPMRKTIQQVLADAHRFYRSGDRGLNALALRSALAVRAARLVYSAIGEQLALQEFDPLHGRAVVPRAKKLRLVAAAAGLCVIKAPLRLGAAKRTALPRALVRYPEDILPV